MPPADGHTDLNQVCLAPGSVPLGQAGLCSSAGAGEARKRPGPARLPIPGQGVCVQVNAKVPGPSKVLCQVRHLGEREAAAGTVLCEREVEGEGKPGEAQYEEDWDGSAAPEVSAPRL